MALLVIRTGDLADGDTPQLYNAPEIIFLQEACNRSLLAEPIIVERTADSMGKKTYQFDQKRATIGGCKRPSLVGQLLHRYASRDQQGFAHQKRPGGLVQPW